MSNPLPTAYSMAPDIFKNTMRRSHVEFEKGWPGISFEDYLDVLEKQDLVSVVRDVFDRTQGKYAKIWNYIDVVLYPWSYGMGAQISKGFKFRCSKPDDMLNDMRFVCTSGQLFCEDWVNCHGPRDCFREVVTSGPGLHVCVTQQAHRVKELHDIHIDQFQMVCLVRDNGTCNYQHTDSGEHYKQVAPWWLAEKIGKPLAKALATAGESPGPDGKPTFIPRGAKY